MKSKRLHANQHDFVVPKIFLDVVRYAKGMFIRNMTALFFVAIALRDDLPAHLSKLLDFVILSFFFQTDERIAPSHRSTARHPLTSPSNITMSPMFLLTAAYRYCPSGDHDTCLAMVVGSSPKSVS